MKKIILPLFTGLLLMAIGCKSGPGGNSDPRTTLVDFFQAFAKKDINEAKKYATKESEGLLSMMEMAMQMGRQMAGEKVDQMFSKFDQQNVEIGEAKIEGDKALVPVKSKSDNESINMVLKKEDGAWKVAFDMTTMRAIGNEKRKEKGMEPVDMNINIDSLSHALQNMDMDSLKKATEKSIETLDSLKDAMKALHK